MKAKIKIIALFGIAFLLNVEDGFSQFATYGKLFLTAEYDQLQFNVPGEKKYWLMSKTVGSNNTALGLYSPDDGEWFTYWNAGTGDMVLKKGKLGVGTTTPRVALQVAGPSESHSAKIISFGNISSSDLITSNTYRSFEGSTFTNGDGGAVQKYIHYRSIYGGYLDYEGRGHGFYSQGGYPRMFMEVISGNHGNIGYLPDDSPIQNGYIYQQIKGPSAGPLSEPIKATGANSTWLWGVKVRWGNGDC